MKTLSKHVLWSVAVLAAALFLSSCYTTQLGAGLDEGTIGIDFSFKRHNMCNNGLSPAITLTGLPAGTRTLVVTMYDLDHPAADHGGGTIENFTGNVIEEGALRQYSGPCPIMTDMRRYKYVIKVKALDENGKELAFGQKMKLCGWVDFQ